MLVNPEPKSVLMLGEKVSQIINVGPRFQPRVLILGFNWQNKQQKI